MAVAGAPLGTSSIAAGSPVLLQVPAVSTVHAVAFNPNPLPGSAATAVAAAVAQQELRQQQQTQQVLAATPFEEHAGALISNRLPWSAFLVNFAVMLASCNAAGLGCKPGLSWILALARQTTGSLIVCSELGGYQEKAHNPASGHYIPFKSAAASITRANDQGG